MASTIEKNNELFPAVVAGDTAARDAMIEGNMALVAVKADALIRQMPSVAYLRDDLVSAGYVGLVKAINKLPSGRVRMEALNSWIGRCVAHEMLQLLPYERTIHVPRVSSHAARNPDTVPWNARPIQTPAVANVFPETLQTHSPLAAMELRDTFRACCQSDAERECLRLREEGYTLEEIGDRLGISKAQAHRLFNRLRNEILSQLEGR
jgi:RNA polymerase sigma factor (sigma-70 family)